MTDIKIGDTFRCIETTRGWEWEAGDDAVVTQVNKMSVTVSNDHRIAFTIMKRHIYPRTDAGLCFEKVTPSESTQQRKIKGNIPSNSKTHLPAFGVTVSAPMPPLDPPWYPEVGNRYVLLKDITTDRLLLKGTILEAEKLGHGFVF